MVHSPKIKGNSKYRVFLNSHFFLILSTQEEMKLWEKAGKKRAGPVLYTPVLSFVSFFFAVSILPPV